MQEVKKDTFELFVFYSNPQFLAHLEAGQITGLIVDLEKKGKFLRQQLYDTQISEHSFGDLKVARTLTDSKIICRINPQPSLNCDEINKVLDYGADELLLPMVKSQEEVERVLGLVNNRAEVGIMLETEEALAQIAELDQLPLSRCYVGLNDLAIQQKRKNIFTPLVDGTLAQIRPKISKKFGVAGLTHPQLGHPIPCAVLIRIMQSLDCSFGVLRRSFYRDLARFDPDEIFSALHQVFEKPQAWASPEISEEDKAIIRNAFA